LIVIVDSKRSKERSKVFVGGKTNGKSVRRNLWGVNGDLVMDGGRELYVVPSN
jgi:hypothetical protein